MKSLRLSPEFGGVGGTIVSQYDSNNNGKGNKVEVTIGIIVHATEDQSKILKALEEATGVEQSDFSSTASLGYFENPITMISTNAITGKKAKKIIGKILGLISKEQIKQLVSEIEQRMEGSRFHMRLDKQELIRSGRVRISDGTTSGSTIKITIHIPTYNKKDTVRTFTEFFDMMITRNES